MDAILDMRMPDVLKEISIGQEIRDALLGHANNLRDIFDFVLNYERGRWDEIDRRRRAWESTKTRFPLAIWRQSNGRGGCSQRTMRKSRSRQSLRDWSRMSGYRREPAANHIRSERGRIAAACYI